MDIEKLIPSKESTLGEKISDAVATFGGSWSFIILFMSILALWILLNSTIMSFDPVPFILLNLFLSLTAAVQAPIIMMSQNRQEARERMKTEKDLLIDYQSVQQLEQVLKMLEELKAQIEDLKSQSLASGQSNTRGNRKSTKKF